MTGDASPEAPDPAAELAPVMALDAEPRPIDAADLTIF
jgi:hypothetical protein